MANDMQAKQNEGMVSTQVMIRLAEILNGRGSISDVEPALQAAVAKELDFYLNQRRNTVTTETVGTADKGAAAVEEGGEVNESAAV